MTVTALAELILPVPNLADIRGCTGGSLLPVDSNWECDVFPAGFPTVGWRNSCPVEEPSGPPGLKVAAPLDRPSLPWKKNIGLLHNEVHQLIHKLQLSFEWDKQRDIFIFF